MEFLKWLFMGTSGAYASRRLVAAHRGWRCEALSERRILLPVGYFHLVFTLPGPIADIAYHNKPRSTVCCLPRRLKPR